MNRKKFEVSDFVGAVITGGSSGIGYEFVRQLRSLNAGIGICNLSRREPPDFCRNNSERRLETHLEADFSQAGMGEQVLPEVKAWIRNLPPGPILLINNSGFGGYGPAWEMDKNWSSGMMQVNMNALVQLSLGLSSEMMERGGAMVMVASTAAFQPTPHMSLYGATKAFVLNFSLALAEDFRGHPVLVQALCPGPTETAFFERAGFGQTPSGMTAMMTSEAVVKLSFRGIARGKKLVVCGRINQLMAGISSKLPKVFAAKLAWHVLKHLRNPSK